MDIDSEYLSSHSVFREDIIPGITLTCINTDKFKTGCLTINLVCKLNNETAASLALLPRVLRRGSKGLPDLQAISAALDELYGARIEPLVRKKGELHCIGLFADFPDDRFLPGGQSVLEETAALLCDMLLSPNMDNGAFRADYVESEKANLIDDIRAAINDKRGYSIDRLLEEMCAGEAYSISKLGCENQAALITPDSLTELYRSILKNSKVEIFYCGSAKPSRVSKALSAVLDSLDSRDNASVPKTEIVLSPPDGAPRECFETLDVSQGKLTIGFRLGKTMLNPDYPALIVFNAIYGGSVTSKLFLNVREKLSLCYYASSMLDKHKGVMLVASGVEFSNFQTALDEIMAQLQHVKDGEITEWELTSSKRYIITSIRSAMDRLGGLEELYFDSVLSLIPYDPVEICNKIEDVTLAQVINVASEVVADTVYFLSGEGGSENDS